MIEQVTIWKRSYDKKYGVCVLVKYPDTPRTDIFQRYKYTFDTIEEAYTRLPHYLQAILEAL